MAGTDAATGVDVRGRMLQPQQGSIVAGSDHRVEEQPLAVGKLSVV